MTTFGIKSKEENQQQYKNKPIFSHVRVNTRDEIHGWIDWAEERRRRWTARTIKQGWLFIVEVSDTSEIHRDKETRKKLELDEKVSDTSEIHRDKETRKKLELDKKV